MYTYGQVTYIYIFISIYVYIWTYWLMLLSLIRKKWSSSFAGSSMCSYTYIQILIWIYMYMWPVHKYKYQYSYVHICNLSIKAISQVTFCLLRSLQTNILTCVLIYISIFIYTYWWPVHKGDQSSGPWPPVQPATPETQALPFPFEYVPLQSISPPSPPAYLLYVCVCVWFVLVCKRVVLNCVCVWFATCK